LDTVYSIQITAIKL